MVFSGLVNSVYSNRKVWATTRDNGNGKIKKGKSFLKFAHESHFLVHYFTVTEQFRRETC